MDTPNTKPWPPNPGSDAKWPHNIGNEAASLGAEFGFWRERYISAVAPPVRKQTGRKKWRSNSHSLPGFAERRRGAAVSYKLLCKHSFLVGSSDA